MKVLESAVPAALSRPVFEIVVVCHFVFACNLTRLRIRSEDGPHAPIDGFWPSLVGTAMLSFISQIPASQPKPATGARLAPRGVSPTFPEDQASTWYRAKKSSTCGGFPRISRSGSRTTIRSGPATPSSQKGSASGLPRSCSHRMCRHWPRSRNGYTPPTVGRSSSFFRRWMRLARMARSNMSCRA